MAQIIKERLDRLGKINLTHGAHESWSEGHCAMEAVAWLAGEKHSDEPQCACPMVRKVVVEINDSLGENATASRNKLLRPLLPSIVGSRSTNPAVNRKRSCLASIAKMATATGETELAVEILKVMLALK